MADRSAKTPTAETDRADSSTDSPSTPFLERTNTAVTQGIERLLQQRRPAWPLAVIRIMFGTILLAWTVTMALDAEDLLGSNALVPEQFATQGRWRWFDLDSTGAVFVALAVLAVAAVLIIAGFRPTMCLLLAFVLLVAVQRRNPVILNSGDLVLRNFALILALCPTGAALSVDRWRRHGRAALRTAPLVAPWGLRLLQLQMMMIYFFAFWSKSGDLWRNGTAVSTVLRVDDITRFDVPDLLTSSVIIIAVFTWGALLIEVGLAFLLWAKPLRPLLIVLGISLHVFIDLFIVVGFFGPLMITGLMAFSDATWIDRIVQRRAEARSGASRILAT